MPVAPPLAVGAADVPEAERGPDGRWNPWSALRRRPHVELRFAPEAGLLGGAMLVLGPGRTFVVLDPALDRRSRRVALAHELVHEERGGGCDAVALPAALDALVARDEAEVVREVARRLVPAPALVRLIAQRDELHDPVAPWELADAFDVDEATVHVALATLAARARTAA